MVFGIYSSEPQVADCKFLGNKTSSVYVVLQRRYFPQLNTVKWNGLKKKEGKNMGIKTCQFLNCCLLSQVEFLHDFCNLRWKPTFDSLMK